MRVDVVGCSTAWSERPTSCYCIDKTILVDSGEGTLKYFNRSGLNFKDIKNIFITHFHSDHSFALTIFLSHYIVYSDEASRKTLTIYGQKGLKEHLTLAQQLYNPEISHFPIEDYVNVVEIIDFTKTIEVENYKIKTFELNHGILSNIAYLFTNNKVRIGFSGDCTDTPGLDEFLKEVDSAFLICSGVKTTKSHLGLDDFKRYMNKYPNKRFLAIHCIDEIYKNYKKYQIEIAKDGGKYIFK